MPTRPALPLPTVAELAILDVLWTRGPSTVREVRADLGRGRDMGYTTVLKLLQIMHAKGLVSREKASRTHVYAAAEASERTQRRLVEDLALRAFGGSAARLALRALSSRPARGAELAAVRDLLARLDRERA
jgi:BlaI family transcriptional regulator, penicillinase repressor